MFTLYRKGEVKLSYIREFGAREFPPIKSIHDAYCTIRMWFSDDIMELKEVAMALFLSQSNQVLGVYRLSEGSATACIIDCSMVAVIALQLNARAVILAHNHPSGNTTPSKQDLEITKKLANGLNFLDIRLLDHFIICKREYHSMAGNGDLEKGGF